MKKRTKRFDEGGMASSGPQSAFMQPRNPNLPPPAITKGCFSFLLTTAQVLGVWAVRELPRAR